MKKNNFKIVVYLLILFLFSPGAYSNERQIQVEVDERIELITIQLNTIKVELWIGQNKARINEKEVLIDANNPNIKPFIENGRTFFTLKVFGREPGVFSQLGFKTASCYPDT